MTKEHFEEANQLYDYMTDVEDNLKKFKVLKNGLTENGRLFMIGFRESGITTDQAKALSKSFDFLRNNCIGGFISIPSGLESEIIEKVCGCLSTELEDCQKEFAAL